MTPLSWIMHQVAKIIICWNFFLIRTLTFSKTNSFAIAKIPLPRIMHQIAKTILYRNCFYIHTLIVIKTTYNAFLLTPLSMIMHQVTKTTLHRNFFYIYVYSYKDKVHYYLIDPIVFTHATGC